MPHLAANHQDNSRPCKGLLFPRQVHLGIGLRTVFSKTPKQIQFCDRESVAEEEKVEGMQMSHL